LRTSGTLANIRRQRALPQLRGLTYFPPKTQRHHPKHPHLEINRDRERPAGAGYLFTFYIRQTGVHMKIIFIAFIPWTGTQ